MTVFRTNEYSEDDDDDDDFGRVNYDICNENCFDDAKDMQDELERAQTKWLSANIFFLLWRLFFVSLTLLY